MERDCNTCAVHIQGESVDDVPASCWTCCASEGNGGPVLPQWKPVEFQKNPEWCPECGTGLDSKRRCALCQMTYVKDTMDVFRPGQIVPVPKGMSIQEFGGILTALQQQVGGAHYKGLKIQPMEYSIANKLNACEHTAIKYITRKKGDRTKRLEDLDKAIHSIELLKQFIEDGTLED